MANVVCCQNTLPTIFFFLEGSVFYDEIMSFLLFCRETFF